METQQLYTPSGEAICPRTNYEEDEAAKIISQLQEALAKVVYSVTYELLKNTDISEWALQASKPSYTADEVGADASGSAQSALVSAKEYSDSAYMQATGYTDTKIAELINGAPSTLDTLKEIADAMSQNASVVEALEAAVGSKASDTEAQGHYSNSTVHVTASEKQKIKEVDNKVSKAGDTMSGSLTAPSFIGALKGNSDTSGVAAKLGRGGNVNSPMTFNMSGQTGQPSWLWGTNDGANHYVWSPANFHVMKANRLRSYAKSFDLSMDYIDAHNYSMPILRDITNERYHVPICSHLDDGNNTINQRIVDMYVDHNYSPWRLVVRVSIDGVLYKRYVELKDNW